MIEMIQAWASEETQVRGAMIVGSQARSVSPADECSDLDVALFAKDPITLLSSGRWVDRFGKTVLTYVEDTAVGSSRERRVLYSDGLDVDFAVFSDSAVDELLRAQDALGTLRRGYRILVDKDGALACISSILGPARPRTGFRLEAAEYVEAVNDFWYHALWTAKKIRRGEIWTAKSGCDGRLKRLLLRMVAWRVLLESEGRTDVWHDGRFFDRWAPPDVRERLPASYSNYSIPGLIDALARTGDLFGDQARRVSSASGIVYPIEVETEVRRLTTQVLAELPISR